MTVLSRQFRNNNPLVLKTRNLLNGPALTPVFISLAILSKGMDSKMQAPVLSDAKRLVEFTPKILHKLGMKRFSELL